MVDQDVEFLISSNKLAQRYYEQIVSMQKIENGMTNSNYLCTTQRGDKYVMRIPGKGTANLINRDEEWSNHQQIKSLNVDVNTVFYDEHTGIKVTRYVEDFFPLIQSSQDKIPLVCEVLKRVHHAPVVFKNKFNVALQLDRYETIARECQISLHEDYHLLKTEFSNRKIPDYLLKNTNWKPCHNDPVTENFLMDAEHKIYLIDWEYSGMNDPLWDLAAFSVENELSDREELLLLASYFDGNVSNEHSWKLLLYKVYQDLLWYVWSEIKIHSGIDFRCYADKRLARAKSNFPGVLVYSYS